MEHYFFQNKFMDKVLFSLFLLFKICGRSFVNDLLLLNVIQSEKTGFKKDVLER